MSDTYILVNDDDVIVNSIVWDGDTKNWQPPPGIRAFHHPSGHWRDGYKWDGKNAYDPNPPPPEPEPPEAKPPAKHDGKPATGMTVI